MFTININMIKIYLKGAKTNSKIVKPDTTLQGILRRRESVLLLFILIIVIGLQIASNFTFLNPQNLLAMVDRKAPEAFVMIGLTYLLITKDFDLSVASVMALSGMVCAWLITQDTLLIIALIGGVIAGSSIGFLNGMIVTKFKVASFIATLGTMYIARSITQIIAQGRPISGMPDSFIAIGTYRIFGIPWYFITLVIVIIVLQILLKKQKSMSKLFYIGTNELSSKMVGINADKMRWIMFIVSAFIASVVGLILTAKSYSASPIAFDKLELRYIAACVIGGASISGGQGSIVGSVLGFVIIVLIGNAMTLFGISPYWEGVIFGCILVIAATTDALSQKKKGR